MYIMDIRYEAFLLSNYLKTSILTTCHVFIFYRNSGCRISRLEIENAKTKGYDYNNDWYTKLQSRSSDSDNICRQISTYQMFLERNINAVISNASCMPRTQLTENVSSTNSNMMEEKTNKRLAILRKERVYQHMK